MINHREWLATRRKLLESVKAEVRLRLGEPRAELSRYARAIERDYRGPWRASRTQVMVGACRRARVVLCADFHAYAQSQRAFVRLLRDHFGDRPVTLALECVRAAHDPAVAAYLAGRMSERRFLATVKWDEDWGFPWAHYRPFFDLARERGYHVVGLNTRGEGSLAARDRWTARRLRELTALSPTPVFAVIGEWHLARPHVPKALGLAPGEVVTILQDVEPLYLERARTRPAAHLEILRAPDNVFCHFVSPPWMKWQSYLMFLDHTYDQEITDELDYSDHVAGLVRVLADDLGVKISRARLQVFGPDSRGSARRLRKSLSAPLEKILRYYFEHDLSFLLPERDWLYLSRATVNHATGLAGLYVHAQLCGRTRALWNFPRDFTGLIWTEAVAFFFSKWINPRRKADTLESVRLQLAARHPRDQGRRVLALALDQRLSEVIYSATARVRPRRMKSPPAGAFIEASRVLGSMLGERLFENVRAGVISLPRLMTYLKINPEHPEFGEFYRRITVELSRERKL